VFFLVVIGLSASFEYPTEGVLVMFENSVEVVKDGSGGISGAKKGFLIRFWKSISIGLSG
jgi:hypothetical protein